MHLEYTTKEGGQWYPLEVSLVKSEVVRQLRLYYHLCDEDVIGTPYRTSVNNVHVQSVRFPDGKIWDSVLCDFDTPENVAAYVAMEKLQCHS